MQLSYFSAPTASGIVSLSLLSGLLQPIVAETIPSFRPPGDPVDYYVNPSWSPGRFTSDVDPSKYMPDFAPGVTTYNLKGRPFIRKGTKIYTINDARTAWEVRDAFSAIKAAYPNWPGTLKTGPYADERVLFDAAGHAYTYMDTAYKNAATSSTANLKGINLLLFSTDNCKTWKLFPVTSSYTSQWQTQDQNSNLNVPPGLLLYTDGGGVVANNKFEILNLSKSGSGTATTLTLNRIAVGSAAGCFGPVLHAGGNLLNTNGNHYYLTWASQIPRSGTPVSPQVSTGTPIYATQINRSTGANSGATFVGWAGNSIDGHNFGSITTTSNGVAHIVFTGHQDRRIMHVRSTSANSTASFSAPEILATEPGGKTYASLICGRNDVLHLAFRFLKDADRTRLGYCKKDTIANSAWSAINTLIKCDRTHYTGWQQQLTLGRTYNALTLSAQYLADDFLLPEYNAYITTWPGDNLQAEGPPPSGGRKTYTNEKPHWPVILQTDNGGNIWKVQSTPGFISQTQP